MKRITDIVFCLLFVAVIALPLVFTNFKKNQISEIDNAYLPEIDASTPQSFVKSAEKYINNRIGFRAQALDIYQVLNDRLFSIMEHPSYMYGSDGYVFFKNDTYITDYQHLNLDEAWAEHFALNLSKIQKFCEQNDKTFLYLVLPDKKTVYPEYFPKTINVINETSRTDQVLAALERHDIRYYWAKDTMLEGKKTMAVNNVKYDAGHWNENGAFLVLRQMYELLRVKHPEIEPLKLEQFEVTEEIMTSLMVSHFRINEAVPLYTLKTDTAEDHTQKFTENLILPSSDDKYATHFKNPECASAPKILVFHDSYLKNYEKFFTQQFSEVTFIHRYNLFNLECLKYYIEQTDADIIIYENPERTWPIDLNKPYTFN